jgi:hypothetical protein
MLIRVDRSKETAPEFIDRTKYLSLDKVIN